MYLLRVLRQKYPTASTSSVTVESMFFQ